MDHKKIKSAIESLLLISGEPLKISRLAKITQMPKPYMENIVMELSAEYTGRESGMIILQKDDQVQIVTNPSNSLYVDKLVEGELNESLSNAALEVISIIAYREPVTRMDIETIRGVNSSFTLRNLLMRGLVDRVENAKNGRSYLYRISFSFLKKLGIRSVKELPDYEKNSKNEKINLALQNR